MMSGDIILEINELKTFEGEWYPLDICYGIPLFNTELNISICDKVILKIRLNKIITNNILINNLINKCILKTIYLILRRHYNNNYIILFYIIYIYKNKFKNKLKTIIYLN